MTRTIQCKYQQIFDQLADWCDLREKLINPSVDCEQCKYYVRLM